MESISNLHYIYFFTENREMLIKIQSWRWWNFFWGWILDQWFLSILRGRLPLPSLYILYFPYNLFYLVNFVIDRITGLGCGAGTQTLEASDCLSSLDDGTLQRVNLIKTGGTPYKLIFIIHTEQDKIQQKLEHFKYSWSVELDRVIGLNWM